MAAGHGPLDQAEAARAQRELGRREISPKFREIADIARLPNQIWRRRLSRLLGRIKQWPCLVPFWVRKNQEKKRVLLEDGGSKLESLMRRL